MEILRLRIGSVRAYGVLPWESNIANKDLVAQEKE